ncbi:MAG: Oligopeptide ABC transporter, periplasmic oligopeptide-binding protein OppA [uncultured Thermomicrobiales bacterium]|uniref:Oligopeptide ABC transporter, periplasmic oligopeptide-binding protein OppA n=1 Tax=uncultured Thermomicrobiales bacterium TaxID=1645740 RepID=A0A6J4VQU7_9BACT|nr:MAG: Oligopeptide ABC transporter, periplasmic oligopeptide-binding protein OppA [uncultured Thermomicrobiales bacterium]
MATSEPISTLPRSRRAVLKGAAGLGLAAPLARLPRGAAARQAGGTLTIAMNGAPTNLDPHSSYDYRSALAIRGPYETLIALDGSATDRYVGAVAESWSTNEDGSVWTFKIRPGVVFQNGDPCDAEAVRLSFERFLTLGLGPVDVVARFVDDPARITAPDAATVVFDLGRPQPIFEAAIASQYGPLIVNAALAREFEEEGDWGDLYMQTNAAEGFGTGAYRITEFEPGRSCVMQRFEGYWGGWDGAEFDTIALRVVEENETRRQLIEQGEVDIVDNLTPEALAALAANPDLALDRSYSTQVAYLMLTEAGPLASPEARRAMNFAFPYDEVIEGVYKGFAKRAVGPVAELTRGFDPETFRYATDLDRARELFAAAGVAEGTELTLMQEAGDEKLKTATQLFQANLAEVGIALAIETVDLGTINATIYGDAPAEERPNVMPSFWWPDYNDAYNHLYPQVSCASWGSKGSNGGYYCNEEVDAGLAAARDAPDAATYDAALAEVQQILSESDPSAIYYVQPEWTTVLRRGIEGFVFNPIYIGTYDFYRLRRVG